MARLHVLESRTICRLGTYTLSSTTCPSPAYPARAYIYLGFAFVVHFALNNNQYTYLPSILFFVPYRVASSARQVNRTNDRFASLVNARLSSLPGSLLNSRKEDSCLGRRQGPSQKPCQSLAFSTLFESFASYYFSHLPGRIALVFDILV